MTNDEPEGMTQMTNGLLAWQAEELLTTPHLISATSRLSRQFLWFLASRPRDRLRLPAGIFTFVINSSFVIRASSFNLPHES